MYKKKWNDQPDEVTRAEPLASFFLEGIGGMVEVRSHETGYFLTTGNLFGSQTIRVPDARAAFRVVGVIAHLERGQSLEISEFPGAEIVEVPQPVK